jgi:DNA-binding CsgD family transcriptional regulator
MRRLKVIYPDTKKHIGKYYVAPKRLDVALTKRELEVLSLKQQGLTYREMAERLGISTQRVYAIKNNIIGRGKILQSVD